MVCIERLIDDENLSIHEVMESGCFWYDDSGWKGVGVISKYNPRLEEQGLIDNFKDFVGQAEFEEFVRTRLNDSVRSALINALFYQGERAGAGLYGESGECDNWDRDWNRYRVMGTRELFLIFKIKVGL